MTDVGAALYGRAWVSHPPPKSRPDHKSKVPPVEQARRKAIEIDPTKAQRIKEQAKLEAAAVMKNWERRTGR